MQQSMLVVDGVEIYNACFSLIKQTAKHYFFQEEQLEHLYDWVICESISRVFSFSIFKHISVLDHPNNDAYRQVYEAIGQYIERVIYLQLNQYDLNKEKNINHLKVLVTYRDIIIVKTKTVNI